MISRRVGSAIAWNTSLLISGDLVTDRLQIYVTDRFHEIIFDFFSLTDRTDLLKRCK